MMVYGFKLQRKTGSYMVAGRDITDNVPLPRSLPKQYDYVLQGKVTMISQPEIWVELTSFLRLRLLTFQM